MKLVGVDLLTLLELELISFLSKRYKARTPVKSYAIIISRLITMSISILRKTSQKTSIIHNNLFIKDYNYYKDDFDT